MARPGSKFAYWTGMCLEIGTSNDPHKVTRLIRDGRGQFLASAGWARSWIRDPYQVPGFGRGGLIPGVDHLAWLSLRPRRLDALGRVD